MSNAIAPATILNYGSPVNWEAPLNRGLLAWWLVLPKRVGGVRWLDLVGRSHGSFTTIGASSSTSGWGATRRLGGFGELRFDGSNDEITLPNIPNYRPTSGITCSAWVRSSSNTGPLIVPATGTATYLYITFDITYQAYWAVTTSGLTDIFGSNNVADGVWHHIVGTYDGANMVLYVDGVQAATSAKTGTMSWASASGLLGAHPDNGSWLTGSMDDVRIYNRGLTALEVKNLYQASRIGYPYELSWMSLPGIWGSPSGGTEFTVSLSGGLTPAGALIKSVSKPFTGSLTPSGALVKQPQKLLSGGVTPAGTLTNLTAKLLAGSLTPAGALATAKVVLLSLAGSLTPSGALVKSISQVLAGTIAPVGSLFKSTSKPFSGSLTPGGTLQKHPQKVLGGSLTPTGTYGPSAVSKGFSGSLTPTGALLKAITKAAFTGAITPTGALFKQVNKALSGSIASSGALSTIKVALLFLSGSLTPSGALSKAISQTLTGTLTPTGALSKSILKAFTGSLTPAGALLKVCQKSLAGALAPAGSLVRLVQKFFSGVLNPSGSLETTGGTPGASPSTNFLIPFWRRRRRP